MKVEDVGAFEGKDVEHYIRTLETISDIYGERRLLLILPCCMKGVAKEWFISIPVDNRHLTRSLAGWSYLLRDGFGEDLRRSKERAASWVYRPWKESVEDYFYDKAAIIRGQNLISRRLSSCGRFVKGCLRIPPSS